MHARPSRAAGALLFRAALHGDIAVTTGMLTSMSPMLPAGGPGPWLSGCSCCSKSDAFHCGSTVCQAARWWLPAAEERLWPGGGCNGALLVWCASWGCVRSSGTCRDDVTAAEKGQAGWEPARQCAAGEMWLKSCG